MITYAVEPWPDIQPEVAALTPEHWKEIALNHAEVVLDPDWDYYMRQHLGGALHCVTVRDADKVMVGYHLSLIINHPHYKSTKHAITDVFYLKPNYRAGYTGIKMFRVFEQSVRSLGVKKIFTATKHHLDLGAIFSRLGYKPVETVYTKILKED